MSFFFFFFFFGLVFGVQIGLRVMDVYYILVFPSFSDGLFPWKARGQRQSSQQASFILFDFISVLKVYCRSVYLC